MVSQLALARLMRGSLVNASRWCLAILGLLPTACGDDDADAEHGADGSVGSTADGSTDSTADETDGPSRVFSIPEGAEFCAFTPPRQAIGDFPFFYFRGLLRPDPTTIPLSEESGLESAAWVSYSLQTDAGGTEVLSVEGQGSVRVESGMVPSAIFFLEESAGWDTVVYTDNQSAPTVRGDRLLIQIAYPLGTSDFSLASPGDLDAELRLHVIGFVPPLVTGDADQRVEMTPCNELQTPVDRLDVTLAEGTVSFHTRPALWGKLHGLTVLAEGTIEGTTFEVGSYWDLEYATSDLGGLRYGVRPLMAARFGGAAGEPCIVVVEWDLQTLGDDLLASVLDCDQNKIRDLTVESFDVVMGGGMDPG